MAKLSARKKHLVKRPTSKSHTQEASFSPSAAEPEKRQPTPLRIHTSFRLERRIKRSPAADEKPLPGSVRIMIKAVQVLWQSRRLFLGITAIVGSLTLALVGSLAGRQAFAEARGTAEFSGFLDGVGESVTLFVYMLGLLGRGNDPAGGVYQFILFTVASLAFIWALRQAYAGHAVRVRDAFYSGMYPLIPFVLVSGVVILQLLPFAIGAAVYSVVMSSGIATTGIEQLLWMPLFILLTLLSFYMITSSLFALYIVTLPEATPLRALRSARELVASRRFAIIRRILFLPFALLATAAVLVVPFILILPPLAPFVLFAVVVLLVPIAHSYMYALYRELL